MNKRIFIAKRDINLLKQRLATAGHFVYEGGLFSADKNFVAYINALTESSCVEDLNGAPVWVEKIEEFKSLVKAKHQEVMNELHHEYKKLTT
tara:strand:+ start:106 stop:381 length:276 start_codon:yes stop_codon:yes gene_type:complete